jgi:hypothetical protein
MGILLVLGLRIYPPTQYNDSEKSIWNNDIKIAIKQNKLAHKQRKEAGKPKRPEHPLLLRKVETRKIYRTEIRKEESKRKHEERDKIIKFFL